jgi:hypothetical protein
LTCRQDFLSNRVSRKTVDRFRFMEGPRKASLPRAPPSSSASPKPRSPRTASSPPPPSRRPRAFSPKPASPAESTTCAASKKTSSSGDSSPPAQDAVYREAYLEKDEPVSVAYGDSKGEERAELPHPAHSGKCLAQNCIAIDVRTSQTRRCVALCQLHSKQSRKKAALQEAVRILASQDTTATKMKTSTAGCRTSSSGSKRVVASTRLS